MKRLFAWKTIILIISALAFFSSCIPLKDSLYLQSSDNSEIKEFAEPFTYRIQPNDYLYIQVLTPDELTSKYFNITSTDRYLNNDAAIELGSYHVDNDGMIEFPLIGNIKVEGLTTHEIKSKVETGVKKYVEEASIVVKLVNRSFTILGEVKTPGTYTFYKDRLTIFEAIGFGHDLTDFGNRKNVKIVRHSSNEKIVKEIDLTDKALIASEFYYIMPNDVIYIEPTNRVYGVKTIPFAAFLTAVNTAVLIYNAFSK